MFKVSEITGSGVQPCYTRRTWARFREFVLTRTEFFSTKKGNSVLYRDDGLAVVELSRQRLRCKANEEGFSEYNLRRQFQTP